MEDAAVVRGRPSDSGCFQHGADLRVKRPTYLKAARVSRRRHVVIGVYNAGGPTGQFRDLRKVIPLRVASLVNVTRATPQLERRGKNARIARLCKSECVTAVPIKFWERNAAARERGNQSSLRFAVYARRSPLQHN